MADAPIGINCKTFLNTGNHSSPTWKVLDDINEESLKLGYDEAATPRRGAPVAESEPAMRQCELTLKVLKDPTNALWQDLQEAFMARTSIDIMALDSAAVHGNGTIDLANTTDGVTGVRYNGKLHGFNEGRNLNDAIYNETTVKPCLNSQFTTVVQSGGSLTYTTPP
jgi:hypothetical protein